MFTSAFLLALSPLAALAHSSSHHNHLGARDGHVKRKGASTGTETLDDADTSSFNYTGKWTHGTVGSATLSWSSAADASYSFTTPKGATGVSISSTLKFDRSSFNVLMDGKVVGNGTTKGGMNLKSKDSETASKTVFKASIADKAAHTWKVVKTDGSGTYLSLDAVEISGVKVATSSLDGYFYGGNNYFAYSMATDQRHQVLDAMKAAGMQYLRIFLTEVGAESKGSNSIAVPDVEPKEVGTYDDTILESIDQLMVDASQRGIKLLIALHDRYAVGFWNTDAYAYKFGVVSGGSGAQQVADASSYYTSTQAQQAIDNRITHVLNHKNAKMGNKAWKDLSEGIFAFEAENEPMGHMDDVDNNWVCDRSKTIKGLVGNSGIMITTGGGTDFTESQKSWNTNCQYVDIVAAHDYGTDSGTAISSLQNIKKIAGKPVLFEEWGASGSSKGSVMSSMVGALKSAGLPWSVWEITNPGNPGDFETWTTEGSAWNALMSGGHAKRSEEETAEPALTVRTPRKLARRSQASRRNERPVERVP